VLTLYITASYMTSTTLALKMHLLADLLPGVRKLQAWVPGLPALVLSNPLTLPDLVL
jgi:hypothetical protein